MDIVTVTLNSAVDRTGFVDRLIAGGLNRLRDVAGDVSGKGINVSRMLHLLGVPSTAIGFVGGGPGDEIVRRLDALGIDHDFVRTGEPTRTNLKVIEGDGRLSEFNEPGPLISEAELAALAEKMAARFRPGSLAVFSGSLPPGVTPERYAEFIRLARDAGCRVFLDADGEALRRGIAEKPAFVKPNLHELAEYFGAPEDLGLEAAAALCARLIESGVGRVALSLGERGGVFLSGKERFYAPALAVDVRSPIGAGDAMVASFAYGESEGWSWRDSAVLAMAAAAAMVTAPGTTPPDRGEVERLRERVRLEAF